MGPHTIVFEEMEHVLWSTKGKYAITIDVGEAPCTATGFLVNGCLFKAIDNSIFQFLEVDNSYQKTNTCTIANIFVTVDLSDDLAKEIVMEK